VQLYIIFIINYEIIYTNYNLVKKHKTNKFITIIHKVSKISLIIDFEGIIFIINQRNINVIVSYKLNIKNRYNIEFTNNRLDYNFSIGKKYTNNMKKSIQNMINLGLRSINYVYQQ